MTNNVHGSSENAKAYLALQHGRDALVNRYDYAAAISWFTQANALYKEGLTAETTEQKRAEALIGLAFSYHNIGNNTLRDQYMAEAQQILCLPDDATNFTDQKRFSELTGSYFVTDGYRYYIRYEQSQRAAGTLDEQEACLHGAQRAFAKAVEIVKACERDSEVSTLAHHGLGTIFEFLSQCQIERGDTDKAKEYAKQSIRAFEQALVLRKQLLGETHLNVARSYHKLARNYVHYADLLSGTEQQKQRESLCIKADEYYKQALAIFAKQGVPVTHPKHQELSDEYRIFQRRNRYSAE